MNAEDFMVVRLVGHNRREWQPFKQVVEPLEDAVGVVDVFFEPLGAFDAQTEMLVNGTVLVISSEHENLLGIL